MTSSEVAWSLPESGECTLTKLDASSILPMPKIFDKHFIFPLCLARSTCFVPEVSVFFLPFHVCSIKFIVKLRMERTENEHSTVIGHTHRTGLHLGSCIVAGFTAQSMHTQAKKKRKRISNALTTTITIVHVRKK